MNPKLHHRFLSFILITLAVLGSIPAGVCQNAEPPSRQICSEPMHCGSLSYIGYPFWGGSRPDYCGYPGFELNCLGDEPLLNISSIIYRIVAIDNSTQTLKVSRNDLRDNLCPRFLFNTTLDFNLFDFYQPPNDQNITLYYGCPVNQTQPFPPNQFNCNVNETTTSSFFVTGEESETETAIGCSTKISVRMNQTSVLDLANAAIASPIRLQDALKSGFSILWKAENRNCDDCVRSGGLCGYDQNLPSFACHCNDGSYLSICNGRRIVNGSKRGLSDKQKHVIIGLSLGIAGIIILSIIVYYRLRNEGQKGNQNVDRILLSHGSLAPKRYSYKEIKKIAKSFTDKLGQGGYGIVYKGELPSGQLVAVKVLKETSEDSEDFINEVVSISRTSHVNIVNLLGFCHDRDKRALVYEFMPNKSLDKFIYKNGLADNPVCYLEWDKLYKIAVGVARGLEYLHGGCNTRIVHFDIKPQNILLDQDFCPKISDFGLAKLFKAKQSIISMIGARGTIGYIAPEVVSRSFGVVSHKSDVYSYGMMLLEMAEARNMVGRETIKSSENYFPDKIYEYVLVKKEELEDGMCEEKEESARKMLMVGFWCIQTAPSERPSMSKVVEMLEGSLQSIQIPPKPFLYTLKLLEHKFSSSFPANTETETGNFLRLDID